MAPLAEVYGEQGRVPQFHGKWPFLRLWGLQEPLSVLASLANLATNSCMVLWFVKRVPSTAPMYWVGHTSTLHYTTLLHHFWNFLHSTKAGL